MLLAIGTSLSIVLKSIIKFFIQFDTIYQVHSETKSPFTRSSGFPDSNITPFQIPWLNKNYSGDFSEREGEKKILRLTFIYEWPSFIKFEERKRPMADATLCNLLRLKDRQLF